MPIFEWDIKHGDNYDLLDHCNQKLIRGWIMSGMINSVWIGLPQTTWSRARRHDDGGPVMLRTAFRAMGLPVLEPAERRKIEVANLLLRFTFSILELCRKMHVPCTLESPNSSFVWETPLVARALAWPQSRQVVTDLCVGHALEAEDSPPLSLR